MNFRQQNFEYIGVKSNHFTNRQMVVTLFCILLLASFSQRVMAEGSRIVKWKDDKGVTHYGDKIPTQYANGENSLINKQGITVKRNKPTDYKNQALEAAEVEQSKRDRALLSAFTNESEIDLARDRNLQLDQVTVEGLQMQKVNSNKRLADMQKYADGFKKNKKPVPADLTKDIANNQGEITKINAQIAERNVTMDATRKRFDNDKKRYIALKSYANGTGPKPEPILITTP